MPSLGVNIDHVATVRQARGCREPDPVWAAAAAELGGADGITIHLREDRRHIQERDLRLLKETVRTKINLEMAVAEEVVGIALDVAPQDACLVPEKREEVTTEGGLDVVGGAARIAEVTRRLIDNGTQVSLFIDPVPEMLRAAVEVGAPCVELHTGAYANATERKDIELELAALSEAVALGRELGLQVNAGHGLTYQNVQPVAAIPGIEEFNIGHSIVSRAVFRGLEAAVREMKRLIREAAPLNR